MSEQDPRVLLQKADKALQSASGGFSFFGNKTEKFENAADLYTQAANCFRVQKMSPSPPTLIYKEAGAAFEKAAAIFTLNLNEPGDAANTLTEAFKVYRKSDPEDAARVLQTAIQHYISTGNFRRAASHQQNLAEVYEVEIGDETRALAAYEKAAEWFEGDNAEALANKHFLKVADLAALKGDYAKAVANFEKVAKSSINNNLMKWSVKEYFMKATMCHLASKDLVATNRALQSYSELDNSFQGTREFALLTDLTQAVEQGDTDAFGDRLYEYDQLSKLDKWKTAIFLRIKNNIEETGEDFS
ncbi:vesicular-fusion protein sec17 [Trichophyton tonsurans CBS 112818]|uniref:Vesicular-fusion protein sec17 n=1 Tax=Trichophyton tonsurans (strain CBS 112818) TaxID=647933 RepID=F2RQQ0_TRIT1|nr:vesicular-fusion protein sec17 [Trichophyton tonsurans CBS 112818]